MIRLVLFTCLVTVCSGAAEARMFGSRSNPVYPSGRIVGGQVSDITKVPWTLALEWDGFQFCAASLIGLKWALTAAHCCHMCTNAVTVRTGSFDYENGGILVNVTRVIRHEKYIDYVDDYDVALVELAEEVTLGPGTQVINLADTEPGVGDAVVVSGWGDLQEGGYCYPTLLNSVEIPVVDRETCQTNYAQYGNITDRMICAGEEGKSSCQGDSGGPAVSGDKQVGIVSWGVGCARRDLPGVYTNIANTEIREWIKTISGI